MGEADITTTPCPRSTVDAPPLKATKDKNCPFCRQAFTSSSLGRHLDLYLRPKNPKAPDGIHIVEEIRKIRGGITRRQAKGSVSLSKKEDGSGGGGGGGGRGGGGGGSGSSGGGGGGRSTSTGSKQGAVSEASSASPRDGDGDGDGNGDNENDNEHEGGMLHVGKTRGQFRNVSWGGQSSRTLAGTATTTPEARSRQASRQARRAELESRRRTSDDGDTARATELALRELLKRVREANAKACGAGLFDFDPYTLSFPALCLHALPAPPTLFSPTPFATAESWSIAPPGQPQFDALNRQVRERLLALQRQRHVNRAYPSGEHSASDASSTATSPLLTPPLLEPDPQKLFGHIADAYNHWMRQTDQTRHECWQLEMLRCYSRADDRRRDVEVQLESARREIEHLKANRWTPGGADLSPVSINLSTDVVKELGKHGMDYRNWDYDRLVDKWKTAIRESKAASLGMAAQKPLPTAPSSTRSCSMASLTAQSFATSNHQDQMSPVKAEGTMPLSAPPTVGDVPASDQLDAEGDDDDDQHVHLTPHTVSDEDSMNCQQPQIQHQQSLPHFHGLPLQPTPMHPSQQLQHMQAQIQVTQAQAHAQVQAHAHAHAHAWAAARQHMNQSHTQDFRPHQHPHQHQQISPHLQHISPHPQHLSPHPQHIGSDNNSRRPSVAMMDPRSMDPNAVAALNNSMVMSTGMDGIEAHQDQFLGMDMGLAAGFVGSNNSGMHGEVKFSS